MKREIASTQDPQEDNDEDNDDANTSLVESEPPCKKVQLSWTTLNLITGEEKVAKTHSFDDPGAPSRECPRIARPVLLEKEPEKDNKDEAEVVQDNSKERHKKRAKGFEDAADERPKKRVKLAETTPEPRMGSLRDARADTGHEYALQDHVLPVSVRLQHRRLKRLRKKHAKWKSYSLKRVLQEEQVRAHQTAKVLEAQIQTDDPALHHDDEVAPAVSLPEAEGDPLETSSPTNERFVIPPRSGTPAPENFRATDHVGSGSGTGAASPSLRTTLAVTEEGEVPTSSTKTIVKNPKQNKVPKPPAVGTRRSARLRGREAAPLPVPKLEHQPTREVSNVPESATDQEAMALIDSKRVSEWEGFSE